MIENFELMRMIGKNKVEDKEEKITEKDMEIQRLKNLVKFLRKKNMVI